MMNAKKTGLPAASAMFPKSAVNIKAVATDKKEGKKNETTHKTDFRGGTAVFRGRPYWGITVDHL